MINNTDFFFLYAPIWEPRAYIYLGSFSKIIYFLKCGSWYIIQKSNVELASKYFNPSDMFFLIKFAMSMKNVAMDFG